MSYSIREDAIQIEQTLLRAERHHDRPLPRRAYREKRAFTRVHQPARRRRDQVCSPADRSTSTSDRNTLTPDRDDSIFRRSRRAERRAAASPASASRCEAALSIRSAANPARMGASSA